MPWTSWTQAQRPLRIALLVAGVAGLATGGLAWWQVRHEREIDLEDVDRRAHLLAHQLSPQVLDALSTADDSALAKLAPRLDGYRRLLGCAVFGPDGTPLVSGPAVAEFSSTMAPAVAGIRDGAEEVRHTAHLHGTHVHAYAVPLRDLLGPQRGVLVVLHDVSYLDERATGRLVAYSFWVALIVLLVVTLVAGITWLQYDRPLRNLADWMRRLRTDDAPAAPPPGLPVTPLLAESHRLANSFRAARSAGRRASRAVVRAHNAWTRERLRTHALDCLRGAELVVVSNREPYMHQHRDGQPLVIVPAGGLVTALDPVLQACGGLWVAHGAGDADRETADTSGRVGVPPHDPRYTLRRVWLSREEEQGYYYGLANEGLWPLCHLSYERPTFRAADWEHYVRANRRFAEAVLTELGDAPACVLVQDYHLALVPGLLKAARPDLCVALFWHIPWPNAEAFRICPWGAELVRGLLGADVVGFHLQQYCNNFLDTVDRTVEARLDWDDFSAELQGHTSRVRPFPISIEPWSERGVPTGAELDRQMAQLRQRHELEEVQVIVGVERIDYTKGLPERFRALDRFFEKYPQHRERFTFVQLGAPSRTHLRRYRALVAELEALADEINWKHQNDGWKPLRFLASHHDAGTVHAFLRMAPVCVVSSLHDGMNLVAKEYVAARGDGDGVLVLSEFAGAARELSDALLVNPYDTEQFANALHAAVTMDEPQRRARLERMRRHVEDFNVYRWAADLLAEACATRAPTPPEEPELVAAEPADVAP
jgi:trehalose 6-phosphate synthase